MKHIITLVAIAFTLSLGACCSKDGTCPMGGKAAAKSDSCCATKGAACKHKH